MSPELRQRINQLATLIDSLIRDQKIKAAIFETVVKIVKTAIIEGEMIEKRRSKPNG